MRPRPQNSLIRLPSQFPCGTPLVISQEACKRRAPVTRGTKYVHLRGVCCHTNATKAGRKGNKGEVNRMSDSAVCMLSCILMWNLVNASRVGSYLPSFQSRNLGTKSPRVVEYCGIWCLFREKLRYVSTQVQIWPDWSNRFSLSTSSLVILVTNDTLQRPPH